MLTDDIALCHAPRDRSALEATLKEMETQRLALVDSQEYDKAKTLRHTYLQTIEEEEQQVIAKELTRQQMEAVRLTKASQMMVEAHQSKWKEIWAEGEKRWAKKLEEQEEKHELELEQLQVEFDRREALKKNNYSMQVRDMLLVEQKLLEGHNYEEAAAIRSRVKHKEAEERRGFEINRQKRKEEAIQRLQKAQEGQARQLKAHVRNEQILMERKRNKDLINLTQLLANKKNDMHHAHCIEIQQAKAAKVSCSEAQAKREAKLKEERERRGMPHGIAPGKAATYRGSQTLLRLQRNKPLSETQSYDPENLPQPADLTQVNMLYTYT
jgi:hypothetical protein